MPAKKKTAPKRPAAKRATAKRAPGSRKTTGAKRSKPRAEERIPFREEPAHEHGFDDFPGFDGEPPPASSFQPGMSAQCLVCPICISLYALQQSRPEAMQHLMVAGHELFLAFRALVEAQGERWDQVNTLQRIDVR